jgi:uncharacterized membrane protein YdbT with pleckstrin-like domain
MPLKFLKRRSDMSYIEKNLMNGENIVYRTHLHWVVFLWPVIFTVVAILLASLGIEAATVAAALFLLAAIITGLNSFIIYKTSEFAVTDRRVIVKVGFIRRNSIEVMLNKVEGIQVDQGIIGRIFRYGSITITGTGGTREPYHRIHAPLEFRKKVQEQIAAVKQ